MSFFNEIGAGNGKADPFGLKPVIFTLYDYVPQAHDKPSFYGKVVVVMNKTSIGKLQTSVGGAKPNHSTSVSPTILRAVPVVAVAAFRNGFSRACSDRNYTKTH